MTILSHFVLVHTFLVPPMIYTLQNVGDRTSVNTVDDAGYAQKSQTHIHVKCEFDLKCNGRDKT